MLLPIPCIKAKKEEVMPMVIELPWHISSQSSKTHPGKILRCMFQFPSTCILKVNLINATLFRWRRYKLLDICNVCNQQHFLNFCRFLHCDYVVRNRNVYCSFKCIYLFFSSKGDKKSTVPRPRNVQWKEPL